MTANLLLLLLLLLRFHKVNCVLIWEGFIVFMDHGFVIKFLLQNVMTVLISVSL